MKRKGLGPLRFWFSASFAALALAACGSAQANLPTTAAAATPTPTAVPTPTPTPTPTPVPTPTVDPHLLTVANITQSIADNKSFEGNTNFDGLTVEVRAGGQIVVVAKPTFFTDEQYFLTYAAEDALLIIQGVKGWYAGVSLIHVQLDADFKDAYGNTITEVGAWLEFRSGTIAKINPSGLTLPTFKQPTDLFAISDAHYIHPGVWQRIKPEHRTSLRTGGNPLIGPLPH